MPIKSSYQPPNSILSQRTVFCGFHSLAVPPVPLQQGESATAPMGRERPFHDGVDSDWTHLGHRLSPELGTVAGAERGAMRYGWKPEATRMGRCPAVAAVL